MNIMINNSANQTLAFRFAFGAARQIAGQITRHGAVIITATLLTVPIVSVGAQEPRKSQHATVTQNVAGTVISVSYNRPVARGREIFGGIVAYGKVWTPGADSATLITFSTDVKVNGTALVAGTYSIWVQPEKDHWTIIFSSAQPVFHIPYPKDKDVLRIESKVQAAQHMETLAIYFPVVEGRHAELAIHWSRVSVPISIDVP